MTTSRPKSLWMELAGFFFDQLVRVVVVLGFSSFSRTMSCSTWSIFLLLFYTWSCTFLPWELIWYGICSTFLLYSFLIGDMIPGRPVSFSFFMRGVILVLLNCPIQTQQHVRSKVEQLAIRDIGNSFDCSSACRLLPAQVWYSWSVQFDQHTRGQFWCRAPGRRFGAATRRRCWWRTWCVRLAWLMRWWTRRRRWRLDPSNCESTRT